MGVLVVLVEGVGAPKYAVAVGTWIALVALMKFVFVPLPVKFALKGNVAKRAPVSALSFGTSAIVAFDRRRGRRREGGRRYGSNLPDSAHKACLG